MARQILDILAGIGDDEELKLASEKIAHQPEMGAQSGAGLEGEIKAQMGGTAMDARAILHEKAMQEAGSQLDAKTWDDKREELTQQATAPTGAQGVAPTDTGRNVRETKTSLPSKTAMKNPIKRVGAFIASKGKAMEQAGKTTKGYGKAKGVAAIASKDKGKLEGAKAMIRKGGKAARRGEKVTAVGRGIRTHGTKAVAGAAGVGAVAGGGYAMGRKKSASLADYYDAISQEDGEKVASEHFDASTLADLESQALTGIFMGRASALGQIKEAAGR